MGLNIYILIGIACAIIIFGLDYESKYPCLEYGPREMSHMQKVGDVYIPIYHEPCLRRAN